MLLNYLNPFIANEIDDGCDILVGTLAFLGRCEFHEQFSIFVRWIGYSGAVVFESLWHIRFGFLVEANARVRWTHCIVFIQCWLANVYQEFGIIFQWNLLIVSTQRHQIVGVTRFWVFCRACIRTQRAGQWMAHNACPPHYYNIALFSGLYMQRMAKIPSIIN